MGVPRYFGGEHNAASAAPATSSINHPSDVSIASIVLDTSAARILCGKSVRPTQSGRQSRGPGPPCPRSCPSPRSPLYHRAAAPAFRMARPRFSGSRASSLDISGQRGQPNARRSAHCAPCSPPFAPVRPRSSPRSQLLGPPAASRQLATFCSFWTVADNADTGFPKTVYTGNGSYEC